MRRAENPLTFVRGRVPRLLSTAWIQVLTLTLTPTLTLTLTPTLTLALTLTLTCSMRRRRSSAWLGQG